MTEFNKKTKKRLEDLAETAEQKYEDMVNIFEAVKAAIKMKQPFLPEVRLINQTINNLEDHYNKKNRKKAKKLFFIPMGVFSDPKDQNKEMRDEILKEWAEPHNHAKMIGEGKVFFMKIGEKTVNGEVIDEKVAISGNHPYETDDVNGVKVVIEGKPWKPGDKIIPRNYLEQIKYGEGEEADYYDNWNYGEALDPAWKCTLFGVGYYTGTKEIKTKDPSSGAVIKKQIEKNLINDGIVCRVSFTGDFADPKSPKFVVKQPIFFSPTMVKAYDQKYTDVLNIQAKAKYNTGLEILPGDNLRLLDYEHKGKIKKGIINKINERVTTQARKIQSFINSEQFEKEPKEKKKQVNKIFKIYEKFVDNELIPLIDLGDIDDYHKNHRAVIDSETGEIKKGKDGVWDETQFNSFAVSECSYTGMYAPSGKPPKMVITDGSLPQDKSLFCKFPQGIDKEMPEGQCLISLTTSRGNQAYDEDSEEYIEDPENAKAIPKIKGIKILCKFDDIDVDKILADIL